jgi:6,7-dimethyl-8-ribityllumazine synthase
MTQVAYELPTATGAFRAARIAFVQSGWHAEIVGQAHQGFIDEITRMGFPADRVDVFRTPGAFEIPLHAQALAKTHRYAAIVAAGLVVDGGIYRHEFVAETVIHAQMRVQLDTETPVFSVVLTPHHFHEHETHQAFFKTHFLTKGAEAARACLATLESLGRLRAAGPVEGRELAGVG